MDYLPLGNTGLYVSRFCMGAMTFAETGQKNVDWIATKGQEFADQMVGMALDAGINFFDTANMYAKGASERMLGKALKGKRHDSVIATKLYFPMGSNPNSVGTSRISVVKEVEDSLKRLDTDYIDLYQVHGWDNTTPIEETMRALDNCVRQGKVRYIGLSNFAAWQIAVANGVADKMGTERFCSAQIYYSLVGRDVERAILPALNHMSMGTMIYSPLASGFLSGKYTDSDGGSGRRSAIAFPPVDQEKGDKVVYVLRDIAKERDLSPAQIALSWVLHQKGVTSVIVGARKISQLEDNLAAYNIKLTEEELKKLDDVSALTQQYPEWQPVMERGQMPGAAIKHSEDVATN